MIKVTFRKQDNTLPSYLKRKYWKKYSNNRIYRSFILWVYRDEEGFPLSTKKYQKKLREQYLVK